MLSAIALSYESPVLPVDASNTDTIWLPGNICAYQFRLD
ncbi:IrmA family protein, partial [Escherichia coli]